MASGLQEYVPPEFDIFESGVIDQTTENYKIAYIQSNDFTANMLWGSKPQIQFICDLQNNLSDFSKAYIQGSLKLGVVNPSGQFIQKGSDRDLFPPGIALAPTPDLAATFIDHFLLRWNDQTVENPSQNCIQSTFINSLLDYSGDYARGNRGQSDLFILDPPGFTQKVNARDELPENIPATCPFLAYGLTDQVANAAGGSGITVGTIRGPSFNPVTGTVTSNHSIGGQFAALTGDIINRDVVYLNPSTGISYPILTYTDAGLSAGPSLYASTGSSTSLPTIARPVIAIPTDAVLTDATPILAVEGGFAQRAALTDYINGLTRGVINFKIPLRRFINFFQSYNKLIYGAQMTLTLYTPQTVILQMIQSYLGNVLKQGFSYAIQMLDLALVVPYITPSAFIVDRLNSQIAAKARAAFLWRYMETIPRGVILANTNTFRDTTNLPSGRPEFIIYTFLDSTYENSPFCSQLASGVAGSNNQIVAAYGTPPTYSIFSNTESFERDAYGKIVQNATLTYAGQQFPNVNYGSIPSDGVRMYDAYLTAAGRQEYSALAAAINFVQFNNNYFMLIFDLRGRATDTTPSNASITVNIQFSAARLSTNTNVNVFMTPIMARKSGIISDGTRLVYKSLDSAESLI